MKNLPLSQQLHALPIRSADGHDDLALTTPLSVSVCHAVRLSGLSRATLYRAIAARRLRARKFGGRTLILASDLKAFLEALPDL